MKLPHEEEYNYGSIELEKKVTQEPYVRCNAKIPQIPENHSVTIIGNKERKWDVYSLMRFNTTHITFCMECAGNSRQSLPYKTDGLQWDNRAVSNTIWSGVLLRSLFIKVPTDAVEVVFTSLDNEFARSLPINVILEKSVILAYLMNGDKLKPEHGAPIRLIVPGWYGMASVKWLDKIYYGDKPFEGKYQTEKYTYKTDSEKIPVTSILPKSIITSIDIQNPIVIKGKAWSGNPISKVEIGINGNWLDVDTMTSVGEYGWVLWEKKMVLKGSYIISSKATDSTGKTQPNEFSYNFYGYGNNAIQSIKIEI